MEKIYYDFMLLSSIILFFIIRKTYKSLKAAAFVSKQYGEYSIEIKLYKLLYLLLFLSSFAFLIYSFLEFTSFIVKD
ncbi:hypothetical protein [Brachyspira murdochii]|uniref:hypothetical protein n=1 Tax=Brachyspira murdochii TaxID=84378 RepID=UPI0012F4B658|nr:hypothetical protein [Brachyspira murdochii]